VIPASPRALYSPTIERNALGEQISLSGSAAPNIRQVPVQRWAGLRGCQREKAGGRYAAGLCSQLPARPSGSAAFPCIQSGHYAVNGGLTSYPVQLRRPRNSRVATASSQGTKGVKEKKMQWCFETIPGGNRTNP
jgi:hypothetical protein